MIRLRNERSVTTVFTCSLTLTDISMGCMGIPFSAIAMAQHRRWIFKDVSLMIPLNYSWIIRDDVTNFKPRSYISQKKRVKHMFNGTVNCYWVSWCSMIFRFSDYFMFLIRLNKWLISHLDTDNQYKIESLAVSDQNDKKCLKISEHMLWNKETHWLDWDRP